ncbi:MAG: hypothetical protein ACO3WO_08530, partial [Burkholderiaceae bacterium]
FALHTVELFHVSGELGNAPLRGAFLFQYGAAKHTSSLREVIFGAKPWPVYCILKGVFVLRLYEFLLYVLPGNGREPSLFKGEIPCESSQR